MKKRYRFVSTTDAETSSGIDFEKPTLTIESVPKLMTIDHTA
jgi:hypothetical protein